MFEPGGFLKKRKMKFIPHEMMIDYPTTIICFPLPFGRSLYSVWLLNTSGS